LSLDECFAWATQTYGYTKPNFASSQIYDWDGAWNAARNDTDRPHGCLLYNGKKWPMFNATKVANITKSDYAPVCKTTKTH
jgi:hypothetical protein